MSGLAARNRDCASRRISPNPYGAISRTAQRTAVSSLNDGFGPVKPSTRNQAMLHRVAFALCLTKLRCRFSVAKNRNPGALIHDLTNRN